MLDERQNDHNKEQRDRWEALLFADSRLVEERSDTQLIEGLVDLRFNIEAWFSISRWMESENEISFFTAAPFLCVVIVT